MKTLWLLFALSATAWSATLTFTRCGNYEVEGYLSNSSPGSLVLTVNKGSRSALVFDLQNPGEIPLGLILKSNVRAQIQVVKQCLYHCEANLVTIEKALDPFEKPKTLDRAHIPAPTSPRDCIP